MTLFEAGRQSVPVRVHSGSIMQLYPRFWKDDFRMYAISGRRGSRSVSEDNCPIDFVQAYRGAPLHCRHDAGDFVRHNQQ